MELLATFTFRTVAFSRPRILQESSVEGAHVRGSPFKKRHGKKGHRKKKKTVSVKKTEVKKYESMQLGVSDTERRCVGRKLHT